MSFLPLFYKILQTFGPCLEKLTSTGSVLIMGDFNSPDVNWFSSNKLASMIFSVTLFLNNLSQLVLKPTHSNNNCLDLTFLIILAQLLSHKTH